IEIEYILKIWINEFPPITIIFVRLMIINVLLESLTNQLIAVLQAANRIKRFQIFGSSIILLNLPISYILLKLGFDATTPFYVAIGLTLLYYFPQIAIVKKEIGLDLFSLKDMVQRVVISTVLVISIPVLCSMFLDFGFLRFIVVSFTGLFSSIVFVFLFGLSRDERYWLKFLIKNR